MSRAPHPIPPDVRRHLDAAPRDERRRLEHVWDLLGDVPTPPGVPDAEAAWQALEARLGDAPSQAAPPRHRAADHRPKQRVRPHARRALAAAVLVLVVIGGGLWLHTRPLTVTAPAGTRVTVMLPDGSVAELNSGTTLRYRRGFRSWPLVPAAARTVSLTGEAFFQVEHDERPFVVETFNTRVEVLGTRFNVRARQAVYERETHVALASGKVRVLNLEASGTGATTLVRPGASARVAGTSAPQLEPTDAGRLTRTLAWRDEGFAAVERPLAAILAEIERRYDVDLTVAAGVALAQEMTVVYQRGVTAEQILHDVCLAQGLLYRPTSRGFELFPRPVTTPSGTTGVTSPRR